MRFSILGCSFLFALSGFGAAFFFLFSFTSVYHLHYWERKGREGNFGMGRQAGHKRGKELIGGGGRESVNLHRVVVLVGVRYIGD